MKISFINKSFWAPLVVALFGMVLFTSCDDDGGGDDPILVEDGIYIKGDATNYADFDIDATMASTRNEVLQEDRASLLEIYIALKGGTGFNIVSVAGETQETWGPGPGWGDVVGADVDNDHPKVTFQKGPIGVTNDEFTVPADGLYHIVFDTDLNVGAIIPVPHWGLIGAATPGGWSTDTELEAGAFDFNSMTFSATDVEMKVGDFKFRYGGGWKVTLDTLLDLGDGKTGVKVNTNYGQAVDNLVPGGDNIANAQSGIYDASITWTAGSGFTAELTRTGDLPAFDYSNTMLGLVGDGLIIDNVMHNWDVTAQIQAPVVAGTVYTWSYTDIGVSTAGGGFKIREGQNWDGLSWGFNDINTFTGDGADQFETNGDGNFIPKIDGAVYNMVLTVDAAADTRTLDIDRI